ncbi:MAG: energy-coupling factor transporter transmembrane protein EcfT [Lachnospiraceae bacterium]|nr:energy-coupling factor transporter transmembrane protein EcfT [Lachnospiraceae bacterium]
MMKDMTIGQFYNTDSVIHRLDPRVKVIFTLVYVMSLFFSRNLVLYVAAFTMLLIYIKLSRVPISFIFKGLRALGMIILFTVVINLFTIQGAKVLVEWHFIRITDAGLQSAIYLGLRLCFMIIGSSMMTYTTTPNALTDGLEKMLGWMKKLHVPVHEFAMIMSIALRFVPILVEELDKVMKAQMARGVDFKEGNLVARLKKLVPIIIPLFVSAVRRSNELALAMDARCYHGGEGRTKMKPLQYKKNDGVAYVFVMMYLASMIAIAIHF